MSWEELRKRGKKLYHLAHYSKKARIRKKNLRRVRDFEKKYNIPAGPIPRLVRGGYWNYGSYTGNFGMVVKYPYPELPLHLANPIIY